MPVLYVAASKSLTQWASDVGLGKHIYKLGAGEEAAAGAVESLNANAFAGVSDWKLVKSQPVEESDEAALIAQLARKEKEVDPTYYPRLRGARGIFKVKLDNVENHLIVKQAMAGAESLAVKVKPADIAGYLMQNALA